jgi:hypothetical protein
MDLPTDGSGQKYLKVGAVRVTYVPASTRKSDDKDWSDGPVIRIQAYADPKGHHSSKVYPGAEYPLEADGVLPLIEALYRLERDAE